MDTATLTLITPSNIMFIIGIIGMIFTVYRYFDNPREALDKRQSLTEVEVDNKTDTINQQMQWQSQSADRRFSEMQQNIKDSTAMAQNHIHTLDTKLEALSGTVNSMNLQITAELTKLSTIISERIPGK